MSVIKTIDISVLPEAEQDLIKALFDKCCERASQKEEKKSEPKVWKPKYCEEYHYIDGSGSIYSAIWFNTRIDNGRWNLGNVFKTQKEEELQEMIKDLLNLCLEDKESYKIPDWAYHYFNADDVKERGRKYFEELDDGDDTYFQKHFYTVWWFDFKG